MLMKLSADPKALRTLGAAKENALFASSLANAASWPSITAQTPFASAALRLRAGAGRLMACNARTMTSAVILKETLTVPARV